MMFRTEQLAFSAEGACSAAAAMLPRHRAAFGCRSSRQSLEQVADHGRGRAPNVAAFVGHGIEPLRLAPNFAAMLLVIATIHQERKRHLEGVHHFTRMHV